MMLAAMYSWVYLEFCLIQAAFMLRAFPCLPRERSICLPSSSDSQAFACSPSMPLVHANGFLDSFGDRQAAASA